MSRFRFVLVSCVMVLALFPRLGEAVNPTGLTGGGLDASDLFLAARSGDMLRLNILLAKKIDVDRGVEKTGRSPLMVAALKGHKDVVVALLARKASVKIKDSLGRSAVHYAVQGRNLDILGAVLAAGGAVDDPAKAGETPLLIAAQYNQAKAITLLAEKGADYKVSDKGGLTPLMWASLNGGRESVEALIVLGADPDRQDPDEMTAVDYANDVQSPGMRKFLLSKSRLAGEIPIEAKQLALANLFRLQAGGDIDAALAAWASDSFKKKWNRVVGAVFDTPDSSIHLNDFFSSAIVHAGSVSSNGAVMGFYNPWHDGIMLALLDTTTDNARVTDFQFVSGETYRRVAEVSAEDVLQLYQPKRSLNIELASAYAPVVKRFDVENPSGKAPVLVPPSLRKDLVADDQELLVIQTRMVFRLSMYRHYFSKSSTTFRKHISDLSRLLSAGNEADLSAALSPALSPDFLSTTLLLPQQVRSGVAVNYVIEAENAWIVALVNPRAPAWFIQVQVEKPLKGLVSAFVQTFDFNSSDALLGLVKEGVE